MKEMGQRGRKGGVLERRAKRVIEEIDESWESISPGSMLRDQIRNALHEIEIEHRWKREQLEELLETECRVDTELMNLENNYRGLTPDKRKNAEVLKGRLFDISKDRRKVRQRHMDRVDELNRELLDLLHKHDMVRG